MLGGRRRDQAKRPNTKDAEEGACSLYFTSCQFIHGNASLPIFQPQIQLLMDIWPHVYHERFVPQGYMSEAYSSEIGNPQSQKPIDSGFLTKLSLPPWVILLRSGC